MRICVLIVDDERQLLGALARGTTDKWIVTLCADGRSALEVLRSPAEFDAIVLDLFLGGELSGQDIYEQLVNDPTSAARCPRIIFQTAGYDHETLIPWFRKVGRPVLAKPVTLDEFERVVMKVASWKGPRGPSFNMRKQPDDSAAFLSHLEERVITTIRDASNARAPQGDHGPDSKSPNGAHRTLAAIADDSHDDSVQRSTTGNHLMIPAGSWLEREVDKLLEKKEKQAALELAAGRWGKLLTFIKWGWWRFLTLGSGYIVARLVEELAKHGIHF